MRLLFVLFVAAVAWQTAPRPLAPLELVFGPQHDDEVSPGRFSATLRRQVGPGEVVLRYEASHSRPTHSVHALSGLGAVECRPDAARLHFASPAAASAAAAALLAGHHLVGHLECAGRSGPTAQAWRLLHNPSSVSPSVLQLSLEEVTVAQLFTSAKVDFHATAFPGGKLHPAAAENAQVLQQHLPAKRSLSSWLSGVWGSVEKLADDIGDIVVNVAKAALTLVDGNLHIDNTWTKTLFSWNFDANYKRAAKAFTFSANIACDNCYAHLDAALHFKLDIDNYELLLADTSVTGSLTVGMGASSTLTGEVHAALDLGTYKVPPIAFTIGGFPVVVETTVPITLGADVTAKVTSKFQQAVVGVGSVTAGVKWQNDRFTPYMNHGVTFSGLTSQSIGGQIDSIIWVRPIIITNVNFMGGPSITFRPYAECVVDTETCDATSLGLVVNAGLQGVLGCSLDIKVAGQTLINKSMKPMSILSQSWGIESVCLKYSNKRSMLALPPTEDSAANFTSVAFLTGSTWHGMMELMDFSPPCEEAYPHAVDYSMQLLATNGTSVQFLVAGNAWDLIQNNTAGYCVFQQVMSGTVDGSILALNTMVDSSLNYYSCDTYFPLKATSLVYKFADDAGFHLVGVFPDTCAVSRMDAPEI